MSLTAFSKYLVMSVKKTAPIHLSRLNNFQIDLTHKATAFPGFVESKTFVAVQESSEPYKCRTPLHLVTFSEWDCEQDWRVWESSEDRKEIFFKTWDNPQQIETANSVLKHSRFDFPLL